MHRHANLILMVGVAAMAAAIWLFVDAFGWVATVIGFPVLALGVTALLASGASPQT